MELKDFVDKVISCKNKTITDEVFLLIQNDKHFMQEYLQLIHEKGLDVVNKYIGKKVKQKYKLTDDGRNKSPKSTLISSHQEFE
ncbi:MAG: hypothetical protein LBE71_05375 [Dysgonamonadaceae bacterium]|nr:hypothetical protein [Dysgonamonadaceae bacterium]